MKIKKLYFLLALLAALVSSPELFAQKDLQINEVFEMYGKKKNVVMVNLSGEMLEDYELSLFKSINIKNDPSAADFVRKCLAQDEKGAKKIKQVVANGVVTSIFLQLPSKGKINRLILFNEQFKPERQLALIYIESENNSDDILKLLLKKK
jgi:hypothetical protein